MHTKTPILKFPLGLITVTDDALRAIPSEAGKEALFRHAMADWGPVDDVLRAENDEAIKRVGYKANVFSKHATNDGVEFFIHTSGDRLHTSVMLAGDMRPDLMPEVFDLGLAPQYDSMYGNSHMTPKAIHCPQGASKILERHRGEGHNGFTEEHSRCYRFGDTLSVQDLGRAGVLYLRTLANHEATILFHSDDAARVMRVNTDRGFAKLCGELANELERGR